jgi:hypothetical protein
MTALALLLAVVAPPPAAHYAARFDCAVRSGLSGRPAEPHQEILTFPSWSTARNIVRVHRRFPTHAVDDTGTLSGASTERSGRLRVSLFTVGPIELFETAPRSGRFAFSGSYIIFDAGPARVEGTCTSDIRVRPAPAPRARGNRP